jgi:hypothetical protein
MYRLDNHGTVGSCARMRVFVCLCTVVSGRVWVYVYVYQLVCVCERVCACVYSTERKCVCIDAPASVSGLRETEVQHVVWFNQYKKALVLVAFMCLCFVCVCVCVCVYLTEKNTCLCRRPYWCV